MKITDVSTKIVELLEPLESEQRHRVIQAALVLLGETFVAKSAKKDELSASGGDGEASHEEADEDFPISKKASHWAKQNGLTKDILAEHFHYDGSVFELIADIPGSSDRTRSHNAYALVGVAQFLKTGVPQFDDAEARRVCEAAGCLDAKNHSTYMKEIGKLAAGSKEKGWTLTAPGLKHAATLIKGGA